MTVFFNKLLLGCCLLEEEEEEEDRPTGVADDGAAEMTGLGISAMGILTTVFSRSILSDDRDEEGGGGGDVEREGSMMAD